MGQIKNIKLHIVTDIKMAKRLSKSDAGALINNIDTFLFDCDGVLWNSHGAIPGAVDLIAKLRNLNKRMFFVTNNSTKSREDLAKNFDKHGFNVNAEELLGTAYLAAMYMKNNLKVSSSNK